MKTTTASTGVVTFSSTTSATSPVKIAKGRWIERTKIKARRRKDAAINDAIYAHIQAIRALGKTTVSPEEIARALQLPLAAVERSVASMTGKGVKVIRNG